VGKTADPLSLPCLLEEIRVLFLSDLPIVTPYNFSHSTYAASAYSVDFPQFYYHPPLPEEISKALTKTHPT